MNSRTPKLDENSALRLPEPPAADYCDELSKAQIDVIRTVWTQDESAMGPLVHEFRW